MAFDTYTEVRTGADEVAGLIKNQIAILNSHKAGISGVVSSLTSLATQYGPILDAINTLVASNPTNPGFVNLQADINQLLADFTELQTTASNLDALVNPVAP